MNLVTNAAEAIPGEGRITLSTSQEEKPDIEGFDAPSDGKFTVIRIMDKLNGVGK